MKRPNRGCIVFLLAGVLGVTAGTARADDPAPAAAPAPAPMAPAEHRFTGEKQSYFISGGVADSPFLSFGTTLPAGMTFSIGVDFNYAGDGLLNPATGMPGTDKVGINGLIYGAYYLVNQFPIGIAAELAVIAPLAPKSFDPFIQFQPGLAVLYAPFHAPVVIGSGLDLAIVKPKTGSVSVHTVTPGLRLVYVF